MQPVPAVEAAQLTVMLLLVTPEVESPVGTLGAAVQATTAGVFWSADPNEGWQRFSDGMPPTDVHCLAFDSHGYLYAGTLSGLFKTTTPQDK